MRWRPVEAGNAILAHYVDRLYVRQDAGPVTAVLGRQRIAWGTGRVWNPTDRFNPINPAAYDRVEKDGVDALSVKYYAGPFTDAEAVVVAEDRFHRWGGGARVRTDLGGYDLSAMAGRFDGLTLAGGDFAGSAFGWGVRGEGVVCLDGAPRYVNLVLGFDNQFSETFYGLTEYFHNGAGGRPYDFAALAAGTIVQVGGDYLYTGVTWRMHPIVTAQAAVSLNLGDGSGFVMPRLAWEAGENLEISAGALLVYGGPGSEYGAYETAAFCSLTLWF